MSYMHLGQTDERAKRISEQLKRTFPQRTVSKVQMFIPKNIFETPEYKQYVIWIQEMKKTYGVNPLIKNLRYPSFFEFKSGIRSMIPVTKSTLFRAWGLKGLDRMPPRFGKIVPGAKILPPEQPRQRPITRFRGFSIYRIIKGYYSVTDPKEIVYYGSNPKTQYRTAEYKSVVEVIKAIIKNQVHQKRIMY